MMQNGPFYRFVKTKEFLEYSKTKADFSLPVSSTHLTSPLSIVPSHSDLSQVDLESMRSGSNAGANPPHTGVNFDISEYIHNL
jgi:hypothetical protein